MKKIIPGGRLDNARKVAGHAAFGALLGFQVGQPVMGGLAAAGAHILTKSGEEPAPENKQHSALGRQFK